MFELMISHLRVKITRQDDDSEIYIWN